MAGNMADAEDFVKDVLTAPAEVVKERVPFYASGRYLVLLRVIYIANVLVAGCALIFVYSARKLVFQCNFSGSCPWLQWVSYFILALLF